VIACLASGVSLAWARSAELDALAGRVVAHLVTQAIVVALTTCGHALDHGVALHALGTCTPGAMVVDATDGVLPAGFGQAGIFALLLDASLVVGALWIG